MSEIIPFKAVKIRNKFTEKVIYYKIAQNYLFLD